MMMIGLKTKKLQTLPEAFLCYISKGLTVIGF